MPFSREDFQTRMNTLLGLATPETQAQVSAILTEMSGEVDGIFARSADLTSTNERLTADNETLREVNTKLFLKVGEVPKGGNPNPEPQPPVGDEPDTTLTYENLFNEKGELM